LLDSKVSLSLQLLAKTGSAKLLDIGVFQALTENLGKAGKGKLNLADAMGAAKTLILFSEVSKAKDVDFPAFGKAHDLFKALRAVGPSFVKSAVPIKSNPPLSGDVQ
jgi:hypothetical protein